jgi:hypothetical protein
MQRTNNQPVVPITEITKHFEKWYLDCVANSLNIGPITTDVVLLWSELHGLKLSSSDIKNVFDLSNKS